MPPRRGKYASPGHQADSDTDAAPDSEARFASLEATQSTMEATMASLQTVVVSLEASQSAMGAKMDSLLEALKQQSAAPLDTTPALNTAPPALPSQTAAIAEQERRERDDLRKSLNEAKKAILGATGGVLFTLANPSWREQGGIAALLKEAEHTAQEHSIPHSARTDLVLRCLEGEALMQARGWTRTQSKRSKGYVPFDELKKFCCEEFKDPFIQKTYEDSWTGPDRIRQGSTDSALDYVNKLTTAMRLGSNAELTDLMPLRLVISYALENVRQDLNTSVLRSRRSQINSLTDLRVVLADIMLDTAPPLPVIHGMFGTAHVQHRGQEAITDADVDDSDSEEPPLDTLEAFRGYYGALVEPYLHRGRYYPTRESMDRLDAQ
mmetsp:Transcript_18600/g.36194  ORF Transcript_18600/g.36194 Transcript_18600/m.36194 type:complete len:380 (+) Transcript_18600:120-1259(+)